MKKHSCSRVPAFIDCASSELDPQFLIDSKNQPATDGTACHEACAVMVSGKEPALDLIARRHDVEEKTLDVLYCYAKRVWSEKLEALCPNARAEVRLESDLVRGIADVLFMDGETMVIIDWKSGWVRLHVMTQLAAYAHAAVAEYGMPKSGVVTMIPVWLRFQEFDVRNISSDDLKAFEDAIHSQRKGIGKIWNPCDRCGYCRMRYECKARESYARSAISSLTEIGAGQLVTGQDLGRLYERSKELEKLLIDYKSALKIAIEADGEIARDDGSKLILDNRKRETISPREAWPIARKHGVPHDALPDLVTMSKTKLLDAVAETAGKGKGAAAKRALLKDLQGADAIKTTISKTIQLIKP